ncbi:GILT-like protein 1 [Ostrinia furnacalis]|uniref:GILT-like protein 1 n=1 Tax=Ostrinia furnacalis TaxID=93504 RepID=UPI00103E4488|nr:GILT-like protein 1 [Ostrinia furnacalis]
MFKKFLFVFVVFVADGFATGYTPQKLFISVYYESRCPDSKAFVLEQLRPAMKLLSDHIMLMLVPFGKARSINQGYGGFQCQHGPSECLGNVVQSCALDQMLDRTDAQKVDYVACEFETFAGAKGDLSCVQKANVSPDLVRDCMASGRGTELQLDAEYLTRLVSPKFVPTVTIDGIFNQQIQDSSQVDLVGTLCSVLKETPICARHYNSMAMRYVLF